MAFVCLALNVWSSPLKSLDCDGAALEIADGIVDEVAVQGEVLTGHVTMLVTITVSRFVAVNISFFIFASLLLIFLVMKILEQKGPH